MTDQMRAQSWLAVVFAGIVASLLPAVRTFAQSSVPPIPSQPISIEGIR